MTNYNVIEIVADFIYLAIIGEKINIQNYIDSLIKKDNTYYFISRINVSVSFKADKLQRKFGKIIIDEGIERAQSYICAKHNSQNKYMLICLEKHESYYILKFPKLHLVDNDDPEKIICNWIINNTSDPLKKSIQKSIKPISLVGFNDEILVYTAKI
jgi:hypothetical protein